MGQDKLFTINIQGKLQGVILSTVVKKLKKETRYRVKFVRFINPSDSLLKSFSDTKEQKDFIITQNKKNIDVTKLENLFVELFPSNFPAIIVEETKSPLLRLWGDLIAQTITINLFSSAQINYLVGTLQQKEEHLKKITGTHFPLEFTLDEIYDLIKTIEGRVVFKDYLENKRSFLVSFLKTFTALSYISSGICNSHISIVPVDFSFEENHSLLNDYSFHKLLIKPEISCSDFTGEHIKVRLSTLDVSIITDKGSRKTSVVLGFQNELDYRKEREVLICTVSSKGISPIGFGSIEETLFPYYIKGLQLAQDIFKKDYKCGDNETGLGSNHNYFLSLHN